MIRDLYDKGLVFAGRVASELGKPCILDTAFLPYPHPKNGPFEAENTAPRKCSRLRADDAGGRR